ncbi:MAG: TRAP transporter small permease subunit [Methylohalobius sp.]|nr:TRAP transporter small permease subunit [Methylohalobius sp.]
MRVFLTIIAGFIRLVDGLNEGLGRVLAWLSLGMVVVTFLIVVLRYGFNQGWIAVQESVIYMHAWLFMLGSAYALKHGAHVRVDIFYRRFRPKVRAWIDFLGTWLLLLPMCGFVFWSGLDYVTASWAIQEASREAGGLHAVFLLKSAILGLAVTLGLQGVAEGSKALLVILGQTLGKDGR